MRAASLDRHTRLINLLKVVLPLAALALLSTLFLLSRTEDPEASIPFADKEIQDRLRDQQVTGPFYTGTTSQGDLISFAAEKLTTPDGRTGANEALDIAVTLEFAAGGDARLSAQRARVDIAANRAELEGDVEVVTSTGFRVRSDLLTSSLSAVDLASPGAVEATTPAGRLTAGAMALTPGEGNDGAQLIFTRGVKLIYSPQQKKE